MRQVKDGRVDWFPVEKPPSQEEAELRIARIEAMLRERGQEGQRGK